MLLFCDWKRKSTERKEKKNLPFFVKVSHKGRGEGMWGKKGIGRERRRVGLRKGLPYKRDTIQSLLSTEQKIHRFSAAYTKIITIVRHLFHLSTAGTKDNIHVTNKNKHSQKINKQLRIASNQRRKKNRLIQGGNPEILSL